MTYDPFHVLILEDNLDDEALVLRALRGCGLPLSIQIARDGEVGLSALGLVGSHAPSRLPDLVVSDYKMPKIDGCEVLKQARLDARLKEVPFVILSSSDDEIGVHHCMKLGASEYIVKPVDFDDYILCIQAIARRWLCSVDTVRNCDTAILRRA